MTPMTRRRLLAAAGVALPAALLPLRPWQALIDVTPASASMRLAGVLAAGDSARAVGREYLRISPTAADELARAVARQLAARGVALQRADDRELRVALGRCVVDDFGADQVVTVAGWVLARTEARLCALAALEERRRDGRRR